MVRRLMPVTYFVGTLLCAALLLGGRARAFVTSDPVPTVLGAWDGFYRVDEADGALGFVSADVTAQSQRRISGMAAMVNAQGALFDAINFNATVPRADFITGNGLTTTGRVVFHAGLETFAGGTGDAGVIDAEFQFVPKKGPGRVVDAVLLHPFPDADSPDVAGNGIGRFQSETDPAFQGKLGLSIFPRDRGSFLGQVDFVPDSPMEAPFSWALRATTSNTGRFVMTAQGKTGKLVADGVVIRPSGGGDESPMFVGGFYKLLLNNGRFDYGAYNFNVR